MTMNHDVQEAYRRFQHNLNRKTKARRATIAALVSVPLLSICAAVFYIYSNKTESPQMLECFVPKGETRELVLADGTLVKLNAGSLFVYPENFGKGSRKVHLSGEASFRVTKNEHQPFFVSTRDFDVKVLGTTFNVESYLDSETSSVVLKQGAVTVLRNNRETAIDVDQKAEFSRSTGKLTVANVKADDYMNWEKGGIYLNRASIEDIIRILENRYSTKVFCSPDKKYEDASITANFQEKVSLTEFLDVMSRLIPGMKYSISDNKVSLK